MTWALIEQKENDFRHSEAAVESRKSDIIALQVKAEMYKKNHQEVELLISESESALSSAQSKLDEFVSQKSLLLSDITSVDQSLEELKFDLKAMNSEFSQLRTQAQEIGSKVQEESRRSGSERKDLLRARLQELESEQSSIHIKISQEQKNEETLLRRGVEVDTQLENLKARRDEVFKHTESINKSLTRAQNSKNDRVRAFGERMPAALAEIRQHGSNFGKPPIGPAGLHIKLLNSQWSKAIEAILHSSVESFIVNDHVDRSKLQKILQHHHLQNPIIVLRFDGEIDVSSGLPDPTFLNALRILEIDNSVVMKMLVILNQVERNILIEDRYSAIEIMKTSPGNVNAIYTRELRMIHGSRSISVNNIYSNPRSPQLLEDPETRILELRAKLVELEGLRSLIEQELKDIYREQELVHQNLQSSKVNADTFTRQLRALKLEARQVQDELEGNENVSQSYFQQELLNIDSRMKVLESQVHANDRQKYDLSSQKDELTSRLRQLDEQVRNAKIDLDSTLAGISSSVTARRKLEKEIEKLEKLAEQECLLLKDAETLLRKLFSELNEMKAAAVIICPRVPVVRSIAELDEELSAQEECLRTHQKHQADPIQIKEELERKKTQFREAEKSVVVNERLIKTLITSLDQRQKAWEDFRRSVSKMSNTEFIFMLNARGFQGCLEYRHFESELLIKVIPQGQQDTSAREYASISSSASIAKRRKPENTPASDDAGTRDVRQLSGGEKSYSTACFLFSLWHAMGSPLRCLDEFDVYMVHYF